MVKWKHGSLQNFYCAGSIPAPVSKVLLLIMLRKSVQVLVFTFVFLLATHYSLSTVSSQDFNSEKAYQDYVFTRSQYDETYKKYEETKDSYLKNPTLSLKEEARIATINMLKVRDDLYRVYLTAIRTKISETKGLTNDEKGSLFTKLDSDVSYYQGHKLTYTGNETLDNVFKINTDVQNHYNSITLPFIYESLFMISYGQEVGIRQDHEKIYQGLSDFLNLKVAEQKLVIDPFNRWFLDISSTMDKLQKSEVGAKTYIQEMYTKKSTNVSSSYDKAVSILSQSIINLKKLNSFVTEFMTAIDNQV